MPLLFLRNFDRAREVLQYATDHGPKALVTHDPARQPDRGYFTVVDGHYYGVFATHAGPVAFRDAQQWMLCENQVLTEMRSLPDGRKRFVVTIRSERVLDVVYQPSGIAVDNWSDDECMIDFFAWLHDGMSSGELGRFVSFYTLSA
ncbi:hypothetical protein [Burkholderia ubonensis]|uniref:hypothetical protein n=1 Tax=Burkholderia ubonensis TaxID=101571 RepID=UPI000758FCF5|nr:hypothetical protein [Burkholderia ubonensis]KVA06548.1 hypothetical protein WI42_26260 [Burkholderia ubonensis]KVA31004.1 hypothetical protein WI43_33665 [Burkholderia ubonensis]KVA40671.1 hypothetical protein WI46_13260 [Burkholderia ubonensis]KVC56251.1 hypothetical protein WI72_15850 [Burkholderia ubonensis]KVD87957.1 hypothetical protein WI90_22395 [Burkholderia ubonensis]